MILCILNMSINIVIFVTPLCVYVYGIMCCSIAESLFFVVILLLLSSISLA